MTEQFVVAVVHPMAPAVETSLSDGSGATCRVLSATTANELAAALAEAALDAIVVDGGALAWVTAELAARPVRPPVLLAVSAAEEGDGIDSVAGLVSWEDRQSWFGVLRRLQAERAERRRDELAQRVRRIERLRTVAEFSSSIAHDLNNLVNPLSLYLDLLERELGLGNTGKALSHVEALRRVAQRGIEHVEQLRDMARPVYGRECAPVLWREVIRDSLALLGPRLVERQLTVSPAGKGEERIRAHHEDMVLCVAHLLENAVDATGPGGAISIATGSDADESWLEIHDSGLGMAPEARQRAALPLYTTKPLGAGLGLTLTEWIVKRYSGSIRIDSEPERGTRVRLGLPIPE